MSQKHEIVWTQCLEMIKDIMGPENEVAFKTWFLPIVPLSLEANRLIVQVPSHYFCEWLEEHYIDMLSRVIRAQLGATAQLKYSVLWDSGSGGEAIATSLPSTGSGSPVNRPVTLPVELTGADGKGMPNPFVIPGLKKIKIDSQLNRVYTLENFVEGECNRLARSAGYAVASNPGRTSFNPLLLHGGVGLGKTHLANAIGLKTKENFPEKTVLYVTSEQFLQQYAEAGRGGTTNDFVHFYEMIDVLIIDDIQFWAGKAERTQQAFFHIFNYLHQNNNQIIITSDKAPADLQGLEPRLLSRLKWGLSADLQTPDVDTRLAILRQKLANDGIEMPEDVIQYIAYSINTNVRELEGALVSLVAQSSLNKKQITLDLAKRMVDHFVKSTTREITIEYIQKVVCDYFNLPVESIQARTRRREIVQARQLAMSFSKQYTKASLAIIGTQCGNKDHATVLHACKTVNNLYHTDKQFQYWVEELDKRFKN